MKKLFYFLAVLMLFMMTACTKDQATEEPEPTEISVSKESIIALKGGGKETIYVTYEGKWKYQIPASAKEWCTIKHVTNTNKIDVIIAANTQANGTKRETTLTISSTTDDKVEPKKIKIKQAGPKDGLVIDKDEYTISPKDSLLSVEMLADVEFDVDVDNTGKEWIEYVGVEDGKNASTKFLKLNIDKNPKKASRRSSVKVVSKDKEEVKLYITQKAGGIIIEQTIPQAPTKKSEAFEVSVMAYATIADVQIEEGQDWITCKDIVAEEDSYQQTLQFTIEKNNNKNEREAVVTIVTEHDEEFTFTIQQRGKDSVANVEAVEGDELVAVSSITSSCKGSYGDTVPENLIDGDMESYYSAAGTIHDMPVSLTCYFTDVDRIDYVDVTPGRVYGKWKETDVYVTTEESQTEYLYGEYDFKESGDVQRVTFQDGLIKPKSVRFEIKDAGMWIAGDGVTSPTLIAAHEITFFAKNSDALSMLEIFTDESFSELKEGVTEEQIDAIPNEFFRNLASDIYAGTYDLKYRAATYKPYPHPDVDMKKFRTSNYSLNDNVTGLYFEAGEHAVFVEETYGIPISLRVVDYQPDTNLPDKSSGWCNEDGHYYPLIKGQNKLNIKRRGLIYVMYHTEDPVAKPIKINFPTALINGYYDLADKSPEKVDWGTILNEAKADHIDMVGEKSIFTLPVQWIKLYCNTDEKAKAVIEQADSIIFLQEQIQGHHLYNTGGHRNRMLFSSTKADAFMFAGAYRTGYSLNYGKTIEDRSRAIGTPMTGNPLYLDGTINMLLNPKKFRVDGWGAYHEVGHVNQLPGFKWNGLAEVTNNFTAMYCAHFFIGDDYPLHKSDYMLLMSGDWYDEKGKNHHTSNRYDAAWQCYNNGRIKAKANDSAGDNEIDETKIPHPFGAYVGGHPDIKQRGIDPFFKIVPFWQLFLYNTLVMGREDFYPKVYHECRTGNLPDGSPNVALTPAEEKENDGYNNDGERQLNFIRLCCDAAQEDLTEFFYNWGFLTPFDGIIEDYGEHKFRVTQEMIDEVYEYAKKYQKPAKENIWFINNHNLDLYRNGNGKNVKGFNIDKHIDDECDGSNIHLYNGMSEYGG